MVGGERLRGIQLSEPDLNCRFFQTGEHPWDSGLNWTLALVRRAVAPCPQAAQHFVPSGAGGNLYVFTGYNTAGVLMVLVIIGQRPEIGCSDEPVRKSAKQVPSYLKHRYPDLPLYGMMAPPGIP